MAARRLALPLNTFPPTFWKLFARVFDQDVCIQLGDKATAAALRVQLGEYRRSLVEYYDTTADVRVVLWAVGSKIEVDGRRVLITLDSGAWPQAKEDIDR